ncbi:MAG: lamin tail domain-containing protein [Anaerolineae bacterium]|nr:lamin tail domain-containing protein [Anaerolineae bacterium]
MTRSASFANRHFIKAVRIFVKSILGAILILLLCAPLKIYGNGPIPFSEDFNSFSGSGFAPTPNIGQLDSDIWIVNGLSDGDILFGDIQTTGDFARGLSAGGVTTGGIYAFDVGGGNNILGVQPIGTDFTPGEITLRLQNNAGATLTQLNIAYDIWYLNDQDRANSLNLSHSSDDITYTSIVALDFTTPQAADALPAWQSTPRSTSLTGLNIANGNFFYLKWTGDDVSGAGNRDEYGLDNVQITLPTGDMPPTVASTTPPNGATAIALDANIDLSFSEDVAVTAPWFDLNCTSSGGHSATVSGGPQNYTLNPDTNFANNETCTITVFAAQVTDQDGAPDTMVADYAFSFTTIAAAGNWVINEIHADPADPNGDANGDGIRDASDDEFIEIINNSGGIVDISGWTLSDGVGLKHTFPAGTVVMDQCPVVVFAGGAPTGVFGGAVVQTASTGQLGLNNDVDTITLNNGAIVQAVYPYGNEANDDQSLTRDPDLTGPDPLVRHSTATGSGGALFSPGVRVDGSLFAMCGPPDIPPIIVSTIPPNGATGIAINTNIDLNFSEDVVVTDPWFNLNCTSSGGHTAVVSGGPQNYTLNPDTDFANNETCTVTVFADQVTDQDGPPDNMTHHEVFTFTTTSPPAPILISEFLYDGATSSTEGDEFIELCNPNAGPVDLTGYKTGDEEVNGGGESMYQLPPGATLAANACLVIAKDAAQFQARFESWPDFETGSLTKYTAWGSGNWALANNGDELLVLGPNDEILDSVAYRNGDYATLGLEPDASAPEPHSLQRIWPVDTNSMPHDFVRTLPNPGQPTMPPSPLAVPPPPAPLPEGMKAYWGDLHAHTTYSDGAGPPYYALAMARAAGLHFFAITDHGWQISAAQWADTLNQTANATAPGQFIALRGLEWTHKTDGHINVFNSNTLLSRTDPMFDTLPKLYNWLAANPEVIAQLNHPGLNYDGDFNNFVFNPHAAPRVFMQEIGNNAQGYVTYEPAFVQSNTLGWRVAPTNNSDIHTAHWGTDSPTRTGLVAPALTQTDLFDAMRARRVFATEDNNLALALRLNGAWMGSVLNTTGTLPAVVDFVDPDPEPLTLYLYDGNLPLAAMPVAASTGQWSTTVNALPGHFFWVKAVQADGDAAYSAPVWIEGQAPPDTIYLNEILPAPRDWDWDGNGEATYQDEWIELFNPLERPVGLGGWRLADSSGWVYDIPLGVVIPAGGFATFYHHQTGFSLNNDGDTITLIHPNGNLIDAFSYPHTPGYDETWCRLPDGHADWSEDCGPSPNAANWARASAGPLQANIFEAKRLALGAWVKVKGRVTAPPGVLGKRNMYIQDDTAGILIYLPEDHRYFNLGDKVEVKGTLKIYHEEFEIAVNERSDIKFLEAGFPPPPLPLATTSLLEPYEGMLVMLQGQAVQFQGRSTLWLDDNTGWAKVYLRQSTGIRKPFIKVGTPVTATGIVSQYSEDEDAPSRNDYRLLLRYQTDLVLPEPAQSPNSWPILLPETGY